jgi:hypothetical protein
MNRYRVLGMVVYEYHELTVIGIHHGGEDGIEYLMGKVGMGRGKVNLVMKSGRSGY